MSMSKRNLIEFLGKTLNCWDDVKKMDAYSLGGWTKLHINNGGMQLIETSGSLNITELDWLKERNPMMVVDVAAVGDVVNINEKHGAYVIRGVILKYISSEQIIYEDKNGREQVISRESVFITLADAQVNAFLSALDDIIDGYRSPYKPAEKAQVIYEALINGVLQIPRYKLVKE